MWDWPAMLLAVAVSLDSLGAGLAYGVRRTRLPLSGYLIIALFSGVLMSVSMAAGASITTAVDAALARALGRVILLGVGAWQINQGWQHFLRTLEPGLDRPIAHLRLSSLGIIVQVIKDPSTADLDRSGRIDTDESLVLGLALGLDAFAAGLGAAMLGFSVQVVPAVVLASALFVALGTLMGRVSPAQAIARKGFALPGLLVILAALL